MRNIGRWYGRPFFESIRPPSLAQFCRIIDWTPDEIQRLVTNTKTELLDPAVHTFHVLDIYGARKQAPSSMCFRVESDRQCNGMVCYLTVSLASITAHLRRGIELTLDLGGFQMEECGNVWTRRIV
jgi:hypothetical protein